MRKGTIFFDDEGNPIGNSFNESFNENDDMFDDDDEMDYDSEFEPEDDDDDYDDYNEDSEFSVCDGEALINESTAEYFMQLLESMNADDRDEIIYSEDYKAFVEAGKLPKNNVIVLNNDSELKKRATIIAINMEKQKQSGLYKEYIKAKRKFEESRKQILDKNLNKAMRIANKQLRTFLKGSNPNNKIARVLDNMAAKK